MSNMCEQRTILRLEEKLESAWAEIARLHNIISEQANELVRLRIELNKTDD